MGQKAAFSNKRDKHSEIINLLVALFVTGFFMVLTFLVGTQYSQNGNYASIIAVALSGIVLYYFSRKLKLVAFALKNTTKAELAAALLLALGMVCALMIDFRNTVIENQKFFSKLLKMIPGSGFLNDYVIIVIALVFGIFCTLAISVALLGVIHFARYISSNPKLLTASDSDGEQNYGICKVLILVAVSTFMIFLSFQDSFWHDEVVWTLGEIIGRDFSQINKQLLSNGYNMPLYYWVIALVYNAFPFGEIFLYLPSVISVVAGLIFLSKGAEILKGKRFGFIVLCIAAASIALITKSASEVRPYGFLFCFSAMTLYAYIKRIKKNNFFNNFLFCISMVLFIYSHWFGALTLLFYGLSDIRLLVKKKLKISSFLPYIAAGGAGLVWFVLIIMNITHNQANTWAKPPLLLAPLQAVNFLVGGSLVFFVTFIIGAIAILKSRSLEDEADLPLQMLICLCGVVGITFVASKFILADRSFFINRYFFTVLPQAVMISAYGAALFIRLLGNVRDKFRLPNLKKMLCVVFTFVLLTNYVTAAACIYMERSTYKTAANKILSSEYNENALVVVGKAARPWIDYYFDKQHKKIPDNVVESYITETDNPQTRTLMFIEQGKQVRDKPFQANDLLKFKYVYTYTVSLPEECEEILNSDYTKIWDVSNETVALYERKG